MVEKSRKPMWAGIATDGHDFENKSLDGSADEMAGLKQLWIKWSIPVTRKTRQLKKDEPRDKIEVHLAGCNNPIKPEVHHELYTEG
ncbi:MAG: hypothetical protein SOY66_09835 [Evtepia sp.]|nr:hypothetical protein [Evtepia sp.]